ncbi:MAG: hypothetical protein K2P81_04750 [Bacteriovoracaceae bacterium]|nr:hypothetical protein [Bacteriovoracaceae bacterium]
MLQDYKSIVSKKSLLLSILFFGVALYFHHHSPPLEIKIDRQRHAIIPRASILRIIDLGLHRGLADLLWVHTLMESDIDHYNATDLQSWIYLRLREIVTFDPKFWDAYYFGSEYLMIVKNDLTGAEDLLKRGLSIYPDNFSLNFKMGYLLAIERQDPAAAFPFFDKVKNDPNRPGYFDSLFAKLAYSKFGAQEAKVMIVESLKKHKPEDEIYKRLYHQLYTLESLTDLDCLNSNLKDCRRTDIEGSPYIFNSGKWTSPKPLLEMKLHYRAEK